MSIEKIREEFEAEWGFTNEEQGCYFIPELNIYGSETINPTAEQKSSAWFSYQRGWQASRAELVIELPPSPYMPDAEPTDMTPYEVGEAQGRCDMWVMTREAIEAAGVKVKP